MFLLPKSCFFSSDFKKIKALSWAQKGLWALRTVSTKP